MTAKAIRVRQTACIIMPLLWGGGGGGQVMRNRHDLIIGQCGGRFVHGSDAGAGPSSRAVVLQRLDQVVFPLVGNRGGGTGATERVQMATGAMVLRGDGFA